MEGYLAFFTSFFFPGKLRARLKTTKKVIIGKPNTTSFSFLCTFDITRESIAI